MKNKNKFLSGFLSLCMLLTLLAPFTSLVSHASDGVVYINNSSDLLDLAKSCSYDAWSVGKTVVLTADISLEGTDFEPIPSFSGSFDGNGHTISELKISNSYSPCGLFASLGKDGVVKNLTVTGAVAPDGDKSCVGGIVGDNSGAIENCSFIGTVIGSADVGGIAGINRVSGSISDCQVAGEIIGESRTGGIVGSNAGIASSCNSNSSVNTIAITPSLSLDNLNLLLSLDITKLPTLTNSTMSNTGGIAGYSNGIIIGCENSGRVGYPHVGYNVGGIVGRSSGHLSGNTNNGSINGRKDVGGIVGQMEPYVSYNLSEDLLDSLRSELDQLSTLIEDSLGDLSTGIPNVSSKLNGLLDNLTGATNAVDKLSGQIGNYGVNIILEVNRFSIILSETASLINDITNDLPELTLLLGDGLDELSASITDVNNASNLAGDSIRDVSGVLSDVLKEISNSLTLSSDSIEKIKEGAELLINAESASREKIEEAITLILDGIEGLNGTAEDIDEYISTLKTVLSQLEAAGGELSEAAEHLAASLSTFADASRVLSGTIQDLNSLLAYLEGVDPIQIPTLPESVQSTATELLIYILNVEAGLQDLNSELTSFGSELLSKLGKINEIFNRLSNDTIDVIYGLKDGSIIDKEVTEGDVSSVTNGKVFSCINKGNVSGDINVGGISGAMGIEYALDPEDDSTATGSALSKKQYQLKTVIHACQSYGEVTSKYDGAGGICGKMSLGLIYNCEAYGEVQSQSGNYVGGIAGIAAGSVSECYSKCLLWGNKYIGGIVGSGVSNDALGDSSVVKNCYSMVKITNFTQYAGGIAGVNVGKYENNLFVSDTLAGIDRVSYKDAAEPISYDELVKRRGIPDRFYSFSLKFVADGKLLYSTEFKYGASFDSSMFPEIPTKEGHYGYWDTSVLSNLVFDTTVNVVYKAYTTAIGSDEKRDDGREIFLVCGEFTDTDKLTLVKNADTSSLKLDNKLFTRDSLVESWILTIPKDNLDLNSIHFLTDLENCRVYVKQGGVWSRVDTADFGSYLVFEAEGDFLEIAIAKHTVKVMPIVVISLIATVALAIVIVVLIKKKKVKTAFPSE